MNGSNKNDWEQKFRLRTAKFSARVAQHSPRKNKRNHIFLLDDPEPTSPPTIFLETMISQILTKIVQIFLGIFHQHFHVDPSACVSCNDTVKLRFILPAI